MNDTAFLIIDMLNDFLLEGAPLEVADARKIILPIRSESEKARVRGEDVIYICDNHEPNDPEFERMEWQPHAIMNTTGACIVKALEPHREDYVITKQSYSGFYNTVLGNYLGLRKIKKLYVTGCVTNICVLYTVADAVQRGYDVTVLQNCVAGINQRHHNFAINQMRLVLGAKIKE